MKETSKRIVHVLPGVHEIRPLVTPALTSNSPFSLCNANRREDVAVQEKSQGLYPKHPSNLLFLLQTLSINFVRKNLREIVREDLIAKSGKVLSLQIPSLYVSSYFLALNNDVKSNIMKLQRVEFDRPGERSPE